jgi:hypothetical protein
MAGLLRSLGKVLKSTPKTAKSIKKAKDVNESMKTGKGTKGASSTKQGTGSGPKGATKTQARNKNRSTVKKARASQKGKTASKLKDRVKNSTERLKGRKKK